MQKVFLFLCCILLAYQSTAQESFPKQCEGIWTGTMEIYQNAKTVDSPKVTFTVQPIVKDSIWVWKTDYISEKYGLITKDYKLILKDTRTQHYQLDENNGIYLDAHCINTKMYSAFEVQNTVLSSSYELQGENLIFEVISSQKTTDTTMVLSHPVKNLQRVVLSRKQ